MNSSGNKLLSLFLGGIMNNEAKAKQKTIEFLKSNKHVALIKGTYQYDKWIGYTKLYRKDKVVVFS